MGATQGLTEFFPVSSSAHLSLMPWIFKYTDPGLAFDIALHAGAMLAIVVALWPQWLELGRGVLKREKKSLALLGFLLLTSIPGAAFGVLFEEQAKTVFRSPLLVAGTLVVFGLILWYVDRICPQKKDQEQMRWTDSLVIGLSQALAIVPGVSRSGATVTAGRVLGFNRETAVKYSFMAALPIITGATIWGLRDVSASMIFSSTWILGFVAAFVSSIWAMKFLIKYVKENDFKIFVWWRFGLAALVIILYLVRR